VGATGRIFQIERFAVHDGPGIRVAVFLKGCPLRCWWCHSPESQSTKPDLIIKEDRCIACGACPPFCQSGAIVNSGAGIETRRDRCTVCGDCVDTCPSGARSIAGRPITVPDLLAEIDKDRVFFGESGGVTFSGGEPLMQPDFLAEALAACRAWGVHTAVETAGFASRLAIQAVFRADLIFFDLKLHDAARHREATGVPNRIILDNFMQLATSHPAVRVRVPLVPGINDDADNLEAIGRLVASVGLKEIDLLPYHTAGVARYARLGRTYPLAGVKPPSPEALAHARQRFERFGLTVQIGG
jgi:pyruvate formate lyase activating enzyme